MDGFDHERMAGSSGRGTGTGNAKRVSIKTSGFTLGISGKSHFSSTSGTVVVSNGVFP
jgi:hypothetical protein